MERSDWLILLLAFKGAESTALDPVRVQKGMFLFAQQSGRPAVECYSFEPYNYGPYCAALKADIRKLVAHGDATDVLVPGYTWSETQLTKHGMHRARELLVAAPHDEAVQLFEIKQRVTGTDFGDLLRAVYADYPEFATKSIFRG